MKNRSPRLYACQLDIVWEDWQANAERVTKLLANARPVAGSLVVLPELFSVGFSMNAQRVADLATGPTIEFLQRLARTWRCTVLAGVPQRQRGHVYNQAICFNRQGRAIARYSKTHLFSPGGEERSYRAGSSLQVFGWRGVRVAPFICYDLRFPEVFRRASAHGAELMVVMANWPAKRDSHWRVLLQARAIENQAFVVGVNRAGSDPNVDYCGNSVIFDPKGDLMAHADACEQVISAEIDGQDCRRWRAEFGALRDRRAGLRVVTLG